jgi:hypothetical protein
MKTEIKQNFATTEIKVTLCQPTIKPNNYSIIIKSNTIHSTAGGIEGLIDGINGMKTGVKENGKVIKIKILKP